MEKEFITEEERRKAKDDQAKRLEFYRLELEVKEKEQKDDGHKGIH